MKKLSSILALSAIVLASQGAMAQSFNNGLPTGWTVSGTAGTSGANGVVSLAPTAGSTAYGWVSTSGSTATAGYNLGQETNGSTLTSSAFTSKVGDSLNFYFNYVTSDGAGFSDYAYANLIDASTGSTVAVLFDARTEASGTIAPGVGLPAPQATLVPASVPIIADAPSWAPLGQSSGLCYADGCGYTGWIQSTYDIAAAGTYELQFGVTNWTDTAYDSGLAFDGITVAGVPISAVPEPTNVTLLLAGLGLMGAALRRRNSAR